MIGLMKGVCIGVVLFECWVDNEEDVLKIFEVGEVCFIFCYYVKVVGLMGGIIFGNMLVFVVENCLEGNEVYCILNEGIGKVLCFGVYL